MAILINHVILIILSSKRWRCLSNVCKKFLSILSVSTWVYRWCVVRWQPMFPIMRRPEVVCDVLSVDNRCSPYFGDQKLYVTCCQLTTDVPHIAATRSWMWHVVHWQRMFPIFLTSNCDCYFLTYYIWLNIMWPCKLCKWGCYKFL